MLETKNMCLQYWQIQRFARAYHHRVHTSEVTYWFHKLDSNNRAPAAHVHALTHTRTHAHTHPHAFFSILSSSITFFDSRMRISIVPSSRHYGMHPLIFESFAISLSLWHAHTHTHFWKRVKSLRHEKGRWWWHISKTNLSETWKKVKLRKNQSKLLNNFNCSFWMNVFVQLVLYNIFVNKNVFFATFSANQKIIKVEIS